MRPSEVVRIVQAVDDSIVLRRGLLKAVRRLERHLNGNAPKVKTNIETHIEPQLVTLRELVDAHPKMTPTTPFVATIDGVEVMVTAALQRIAVVDNGDPMDKQTVNLSLVTVDPDVLSWQPARDKHWQGMSRASARGRNAAKAQRDKAAV